MAALTPAERAAVHADGLALLAEQSAPQDPSCLPTLRVADIDPVGVTYPPAKSVWPPGAAPTFSRAVPLFVQTQPTNGVCYFRASVDLAHVPAALHPYLPLFGQLLTKCVCSACARVCMLCCVPILAMVAVVVVVVIFCVFVFFPRVLHGRLGR